MTLRVIAFAIYIGLAPSNGMLTLANGQPTISMYATTEAQTSRPIDSSPPVDSSTKASFSVTASAASNVTYKLNSTSTAARWMSLSTESMTTTATSPALYSTAAAAAATGAATTTPTAPGRPTNSSTAAEKAASSTAAAATAFADEPRPASEWTRIINAPAAFVEPTTYNVTCVGTPNVTRWIIGRHTATQRGTRISRWLFTNTLSIVTQRRMHNWTLSCIGGNVTADENNTLLMQVWWGPSFGGTRRTVQILPYSDATYLASCGGLSGNPPLRYLWQTASGWRQPFNESAAIAFANPTTTNATDQPSRVAIPIQDDLRMSYLSVPVLLVLPLPIGSGSAAASAAAESRASCRAWNPASGAVDSVDVVLKTSRPGSLSYSGIQPQASYTVGQTIAVSCTVRSTFVQAIGLRRGFLGEHEVVSCAANTPLLRGLSRLPGRTRASVSLRVGTPPPPAAAAAAVASETTAADGGADAYAALLTVAVDSSPAAAAFNRPATCGDVPWRSADGFTLTFTLYDVDAALTGPYQCYAIDEQPYYYAYVSPALIVDTTTTRTTSDEAPLVSDFFFISIYDIPSIPRIFVQRALVEGERQDLACSSSGDSPAPSLRWTLITGSESVSVYQLDSSVTLVARRQFHSSILRVSFVANRRMDGKVLRCAIEGHPLGFSYQNVVVLRVVYGPTMADSNRSGVVIRRPLWEPLWLPCRVDSKPPAVIWWYMRSPSGSVSTIPRDYYQSSQGVILEVPYAFREPGQVAYICRAFNLESRKTSDLEVSVVWVQRGGGPPNDGSTTDLESGDGGAYDPFGPPAATKRPPKASPQKVLIYVVIPIVTLASVLLAFVCAIACLLSRRPSDVFLTGKGIGDDRGGRGASGHTAQHYTVILPPPGHGRHPVVPNANGSQKPGSAHRPAKSAGHNEAVGTSVSPTGGAYSVPGAPADHRASPKAHKRKATHRGGDKQPKVNIRTARTAAGGNEGSSSPERKRLASARQRDGTQRTAAGRPEAARPTRGQHVMKAAARQGTSLGPQSAHAKEMAGAATEAGLAKKERKRESRERIDKKQASSSPHSKKKRYEHDASAKRRKAVETGSLPQGDEGAAAAATPAEHGTALPNEEQAVHPLTAVKSAKDRLRRTLAKTVRRDDDTNGAQRRAAEPDTNVAVARRQQQSPPPAAEGHQPVAATRELVPEDRKAKAAVMPAVAPEGAGAIGAAALSGDKRAEVVSGGLAKRSPRKGRQQRAVTYNPAIATAVTTVA